MPRHRPCPIHCAARMQPANILLTESCDLKLCDFGLARSIDVEEDTAEDEESEEVRDMLGVAGRSAGASASAEEGPSPASASTTSSSGAAADTAAGGAGASAGGSATATSAATNMARSMTRHVVTRWYRAPELPLYSESAQPPCRRSLALHCTHAHSHARCDSQMTAPTRWRSTSGPSAAVTLRCWACWYVHTLPILMQSAVFHVPLPLPSQDTGDPECRYDRRALFPGGSCYPMSKDRSGTTKDKSGKEKKDQLQTIFDVLGTPTEDEISRVRTETAQEYLRSLKIKKAEDMMKRYPTAGKDAVDLLRRFLRFNPEDRITIDEALAHPFLAPVRRPHDEVRHVTCCQRARPASRQ